MARRRCYPSDTFDDEWALIEPLLPAPACEGPRGGRPEKHPRREVVDAIRYVVDTGCKWRALPKDFPPWRTCYGFMARWAAAGVVGQIRDQLRKRIRREMGRAPGAVATVIDSQSVKAAETVGKDSRGYDGAKKINGRKRHLVTAHPALGVADHLGSHHTHDQAHHPQAVPPPPQPADTPRERQGLTVARTTATPLLPRRGSSSHSPMSPLTRPDSAAPPP